MSTLSRTERDDQSVDDELDEPELDALLDDEMPDVVLVVESLDDVPEAVLSDEPEDPDAPLSEDSLVPDDAVEVADFLPRLSVLKKPEPLKVTPTGVKTFLTGRTSPVWGWAISVRLSSWKPCWTSMVSPVSTNL